LPPLQDEREASGVVRSFKKVHCLSPGYRWDANMDSAKTVLSFIVKVKKTDPLKEKLEYTVNDHSFGLSWEYSDVFIKVEPAL